MKFNSIEELLEYTENIKGKTFREIDSKNLLANVGRHNKGLLGHIVESGFYDYPINSDARADFDNIGVELKVTGYTINKNGRRRAKERLVLSKINYFNVVNEEYNYSKLLFKNKKILIIWYHYDYNKDIGDFLITDYQLYDMGKDEDIFKNDFEIIKEKLKKGLAHELSEGDTSYLGACTKAAKSTDRTKQPYSNILAKPRAFSLKNAYMTGILKNLAYEKETPSENNMQRTLDEIDETFTLKTYKTVNEYINCKLEPYFGMNQLDILEKATRKNYSDKIPKNLNKIITDKLIGKDEELADKDDLFKKTSFIIKNLPITPKNTPRERMSFRTLILSEFEENWDNSDWKMFFEQTTLITILWKEPRSGSKNGERILDSVLKISFDDEDLESFEKTYNLVKKTIENKDIKYLPVPGTFKNQYLVIAPKGVKGDDAYNNFFKKDKTKVSFMLSKEFLNKKIKQSNFNLKK